MKKKLSLDVDALSVRSFDTSSTEGGGRGTVHGAATQPVDHCTCDDSCACPSAYFYCNTGAAHTNFSCNFTNNVSCWFSQGCPPDA